jgi:hypothetical protein
MIKSDKPANDKSQAENEKNSEAYKTISKKIKYKDLEDDSEDKKSCKKETKRFR